MRETLGNDTLIVDQLFRHEIFVASSARGAVLVSVNCTECNLSKSVLRDVAMFDVHFYYCRIVGADLRGSRLANVTFEHCEFGGADFASAYLSGIRFVSSSIRQLDLRGAMVGDLSFRKTDLSQMLIDADTKLLVEDSDDNQHVPLSADRYSCETLDPETAPKILVNFLARGGIRIPNDRKSELRRLLDYFIESGTDTLNTTSLMKQLLNHGAEAVTGGIRFKENYYSSDAVRQMWLRARKSRSGQS